MESFLPEPIQSPARLSRLRQKPPASRGTKPAWQNGSINRRRIVGDCLERLGSQDFSGTYEVILIDNHSTDQTAKIARLHGATVVGEQHPGVCWARRAGTLVARGEIIVSTDADTTFDRGWLSRIDQTFSASPDCVAVAVPCRFLAAPWWGGLFVWLLIH